MPESTYNLLLAFIQRELLGETIHPHGAKSLWDIEKGFFVAFIPTVVTMAQGDLDALRRLACREDYGMVRQPLRQPDVSLLLLHALAEADPGGHQLRLAASDLDAPGFVRAEAAKLLGLQKGPESSEALRVLLLDPLQSLDARVEALKALAATGDPAHLPAVHAFAAGGGKDIGWEERVREEILWARALLRDPVALPDLLHLAFPAGEEDSASGLAALKRYLPAMGGVLPASNQLPAFRAGEPLKARLLNLTRHRDAAVRRWVLRELGGLELEPAEIEHVFSLLGDEDAPTAAAAGDWFCLLKGPPVGRLRSVLKEERAPRLLRLGAAWTLLRLGHRPGKALESIHEVLVPLPSVITSQLRQTILRLWGESLRVGTDVRWLLEAALCGPGEDTMEDDLQRLRKVFVENGLDPQGVGDYGELRGNWTSTRHSVVLTRHFDLWLSERGRFIAPMPPGEAPPESSGDRERVEALRLAQTLTTLLGWTWLSDAALATPFPGLIIKRFHYTTPPTVRDLLFGFHD